MRTVLSLRSLTVYMLWNAHLVLSRDDVVDYLRARGHLAWVGMTKYEN